MKTSGGGRIGCLGAVLKFLGIRLKAKDEALPYRLRDDFLSPVERSFYGVLKGALGDRAVVCPKVRVADVLFVANRDNKMSHQNRISAKHIDFLVCDAASMRPRVAVELDDASHRQVRRRERDELLDGAFAAAGLPLVRVAVRRAYSGVEILTALLPHLGAAPVKAPSPPVAPATAGPPRCPRCGVPMISRQARRGQQAGRAFWGCPNYPRCRELVNDTAA